MCDPTIATILTVASTAFSAFSAHQQSKDAADMMEVRQGIALQQAADARDRGQVAEEAHRRKVMQFKGTQRATLASNLVELDSGSASDLQADTAMLGELDALTIRNNAEREAYYYESQAAGAAFQADQYDRKANFDLLGGAMSSASAVADKWYDNKSALTKPGAGFSTSYGSMMV